MATSLTPHVETGKTYAVADPAIIQWFDAHMRHFTSFEVACTCCGNLVFQPEALQRLDAMRKTFGAPVLVYSGTRCARHNRKVGGAPQSKHLSGTAFDVAPAKGEGTVRLLEAGLRAGFIGIGLYPGRFIHLDTGPERIWVG